MLLQKHLTKYHWKYKFAYDRSLCFWCHLRNHSQIYGMNLSPVFLNLRGFCLCLSVPPVSVSCVCLFFYICINYWSLCKSSLFSCLISSFFSLLNYLKVLQITWDFMYLLKIVIFLNNCNPIISTALGTGQMGPLPCAVYFGVPFLNFPESHQRHPFSFSQCLKDKVPQVLLF